MIVDEEEELVLQDGTAEGSAEDVAGVGVFRSVGEVVHPAVGVQVVVVQEVEGASVPAVGTALGLVEDVAAIDVAILGVGIGGDDLDLADGVDAGVVARVSSRVWLMFIPSRRYWLACWRLPLTET